MNNKIITIDGPVASGKSSLARVLACELGYYHINSGYFYRVLAYILLHYCKKTLDELRVLEEADLDCILLEEIEYKFENGEPQVLYKDLDLTPMLKSRDIDDGSSIISTFSFIRTIVNRFQHAVAGGHDIVIDGRDIGSVIFPDAQIKIFLTATESERARRWQEDQKRKGRMFSFEESLSEVQERDRRDTTRTVAPLIIPDGALVIDNSELSNEEVLQQVKDLL